MKLRFPQNKTECDIVCRRGAFETLKVKDPFVFTDENVYRLYGKKIKNVFPDAPVFAMRAGEENKNEATLFALLRAMAEHGVRRNGTLVMIGGGVVGDLGGLAAALYMRGIACVQVPTTLLAQVDSSVGGKTAIDFEGIKNLIGIIRQPQTVIVDPSFLKTLPEREVRCGLGEIVKHGALNGELFDVLYANRARLTDVSFLASLVKKNIAIKAEVVKKDPDEKGLRKCLNLGHTTGHAIELSTRFSHGECVLWGLLIEAALAKKYTACDGEYLTKLSLLVKEALGKGSLPDLKEACARAKLDKKNVSAGKVVMAVPVAKGEYTLLELPFEEYYSEVLSLQEQLC